MGILGRLSDILNANINDMLDRAENPEKMIRQIIREIEDSIDKAKQDLAKVLIEAKQREKDLAAKEKDVAEWSRRAEMAVNQENDELAKLALERKLAHEKQLRVLEEQLGDIREAAENMKQSIVTLQDKFAEASARRASLTARAQAAKTGKQAQQTARDFESPNKVLGKFERFAQRVEGLEAERAAGEAVREAGLEAEQHFRKMEDQLVVENELQALKARKKG